MHPKILVVDNELDVLKSTQMILDRLGYECVVLPDARHVVQVADRESVDCILLDLVMPGMDATATVKKLRKNADTAKVPIILFSASSELADAAAELDVEGYLAKPFAEQEIFEVLGRALGSKAVQAKSSSRSAEQKVAEVVAREERESERQVVRSYFHDYWNILTALNNYAQFIVNEPGLRPAQKEAAQEISRLVLELEKKTDALRATLLEYVG
jgi:DNA-binding response OmpR family regulator